MRNLRLASLLLTLPLLLVGCDDDPEPNPATAEPSSPTEPSPSEPHAGLDVDDPTVCAGCHATVVEEWRTSMHASAHHEADPLYGAMRRFRIGREGEELASRCAQCHSPRDPAQPDSEVSRVGVGCASCHAVAAIDTAGGTRRGARALSWSEDGAMRGPHDVAADAPAPHGTGDAAPWIADGQTICLTCHGAMQNGQGVDTCTTGTEYDQASGDRPCTSCHMPEVEGASGSVSTRSVHRSHAFVGPHGLLRDSPETFMATAVTLLPVLEGTGLSASLHNETQHSFPTGFPGRMVLVRATGFDADGQAVWRNFEDDPMAQDSAAVLHKAYVDGEGNPTLPPYAARIARDTRLSPGETRAFHWTVPDTVVRAELTLIFRLMPTAALERLQVGDIAEARPRPFLTVATP